MDQKPTIFEFTSFQFKPADKKVIFNYKQLFENGESLDLTETLILPATPDISNIPEGLLNKILEALHLILGISYYKFYCSEKISHPYKLTKKEADFWSTVYRKGLGEFFYKNKLNPEICARFEYSKNATIERFRVERNNKCLIAIGGGKDSIVAAELLKKEKHGMTLFFVQTQRESKIVEGIVKKLGVKFLKLNRVLDYKINQPHKYDGHIPISAIFAFLGIFSAILYKFSYYIVANEYSSNFGNLKYKGEEINHQWSKSYEFEALFSDYLENFLTPDIKYFSILRPFYEIRIAKIFSKFKKYFHFFSSCNKNFRIFSSLTTPQERVGKWCGECPKCLFVFILLSAFLNKKELLSIFKKNLYEEKKLLPLFKDILGFGKIKPFDCVGTFLEARTAFKMASKKFGDNFIMRQLLPRIKLKRKEIETLFRAYKSLNIPPQFRFCGMENALILGYGKEGEVSKRYLLRKYSKIKIGIADQKQSKNYLEKQFSYDIAIKTPGIPKNKVKIQYTTATNIFFSEIRKRGNKIIGVTGSKGKSTTASLIYSILKEAGKNVKLFGNIGEPMLKALFRPIKKDEIFVLELSSYQLDDIEFSPDIAVITTLFPEHMDYHGSVKEYYQAKRNIIRFQDKNGIFVYNPRKREVLEWLTDYSGKAVPFFDEKFLVDLKTSLVGQHNKENILAAVAVAKEMEIEESIIRRAIEKFKPLPHRLAFVGEFRGIKFYDDAISTTPESTIAAIEALKDVDTIFLGGEDRGYNFKELEKVIKKYKIRNLVLFPPSGNRIKVKNVNILKTRSMREAVEFAYKNTARGKICLLSCASPSYSLWKNFEEKGDEFVKFVKMLGDAGIRKK